MNIARRPQSPSSRSRVLALAILCIGSSAASACRSAPGYHLLASFPHKDAMDLVVFLEARGDVQAYRSITRAEIERVERTRGADSVPLYEIRVDFHSAKEPFEKLASIVVRRRPAEHNPQRDPERAGDAMALAREAWEVFLY